jgi:hypothetical protein
MAKAISSATDFISAIAQKTELFEVEGVTVELRSLDWGEVQQILGNSTSNNMEQLFQFALAGLAAPKIEEAQLRKARAIFITSIGTRVGQMSGTAGDSTGPLAGGGSSA